MKLYGFLAVTALLPLGAAAQDLDYTFVELSYLDSELDAGFVDIGGDGLGISGSLSVSDSVFLFANYATQDYKFGIDATSYDLGAGMRWGLKQGLDLVGEAAWVKTEVKFGGMKADDDGFGLGLGLRGRVNNALELQGGLRYVDMEDSDTFVALMGRWHFNNTWAAGLGLNFNDDVTSWSLGLRANFGN
jgi:hypothetical protein